MKSILIFFLVLFQISYITAAYPPIDKCKLSDSECVKTSAQKALLPFVEGVPEFDIEVLDAMNIKHINFELAGLKLDLTDSTLKGLKKSTIEKIRFNSKKKQFDLILKLEDLVLQGHYIASGQLLILPINGDGILTIKMKKLILEASMPYEIIKNAAGADSIHLKSFRFKYDFKENVHFHLTNLFNGNKELSDTMHLFMNDNWKQVVEEFGRPIIQQAYLIIFENVKKFLAQPLTDIALE